MTELKWNQPQDQVFESGLDRGVIYPELLLKPVVWNGLTSVDDAGESTVKEFYIDGIKFLTTVSPRDWKGSIEAYTYPDEFAKLLGVAELGDGLYVDSQAPGRFNLSYRTMVGSNAETTVQHYKIHLIYQAMASLGDFTNQTLSGGVTNPTAFKFDVSAVPIKISGMRPSAHVIIDTRDIDMVTRERIETILYGSETTIPSMPTVEELSDMLNYGDGVVVTDNGDGTWTATGSIRNVYMTSDDNFEIDNVTAEYLSPDVYQFFGDGSGPGSLTLSFDEDGVPYFQLGAGLSNVGIDTDGVPYYEIGKSDAAILADTDGVPYFTTE